MQDARQRKSEGDCDRIGQKVAEPRMATRNPQLHDFKYGAERNPTNIQIEWGGLRICRAERYSADEKPGQMLEQVGKSGYRPESRRHYGHNESRARNEPGARAQYQISHGTAAEWDNEPVGLRWGDGGVQVSRNLEVNTGTSDARAANRAIHARPRHGGRQFPSRSSVLISCGLRDHPLCRMRLPR